MSRSRSAAAALLLTLLPVFPSSAQTPAAPKSEPPAARRPRDPSRQVPPFFGQIGLTPEQRESIYAARARHQAKLDELEAEIVRVKAAMLGDCEAVLSPVQKELLAHRRSLSTSTRPGPDATPAKPDAK